MARRLVDDVAMATEGGHGVCLTDAARRLARPRGAPRTHDEVKEGRTREAIMSDIAKLLQRIEERLAVLESRAQEGPIHWQAFHLHNALTALQNDHAAADLHLDAFDRAEIAKEFPELEADKVPTVEEIRSRFDMIAGGML